MSKGMYIDPQLVASKAFLSLSGVAPHVLLLFLKRRKMKKMGRTGKGSWFIKNNGEIVFPYEEALKKFKITKPRFRRALSQLVEKGFIDIAHSGGGLNGDCSKYAISDRWQEYGTARFIQKSPPIDTRGLGITSDNWEQITGRKRRNSKSGNENIPKASNKSVTTGPETYHQTGNENVTEEKSPKIIHLKGFSMVRCFSRTG